MALDTLYTFIGDNFAVCKENNNNKKVWYIINHFIPFLCVCVCVCLLNIYTTRCYVILISLLKPKVKKKKKKKKIHHLKEEELGTYILSPPYIYIYIYIYRFRDTRL